MTNFSDIHYSILGLLAECGCVSRTTLDLMDYTTNYMNRSLHALIDASLIRIYGKGQGKHYALTADGRNHLTAHNPIRFRKEFMALNRKLTEHHDRAMLCGDAAAMLSFAGYAVHPDDKPPLPAHTPTLPQPPDYQHWKSLCRNLTMHTYPAGEDDREYGKRLTAIGSYYDSVLLKNLLLADGNNKDSQGARYSRACGVLMTPDYLLRVFHSRDVAIKLKITGEKNFTKLLTTGLVYSGYLPTGLDGLLVFGNGFSAARLVIEHNLNGDRKDLPYYVRKKGKAGNKKKPEYELLKGTGEGGELLRPGDIGNPIFYLPLNSGGLELLPLFQFPGWADVLHRGINRQAFGIADQPMWCFNLDGRMVYVLASLNLTDIDHTLRMIKTKPAQPFAIACLEWQLPLFSDLLMPFKEQDIVVKVMPRDFMEKMTANLYDIWR